MKRLPPVAAMKMSTLLLVAPVAIASAPAWADTPAIEAEQVDPRAGDPAYQRSQKLFGILRDILDEAARERLDSQVDPDSPVEDFFLRQFGMDQGSRIRELLGSAFEMMTDTPVTELQGAITDAREQIAQLKRQIADLRERRISAPEDAGWEGWLGVSEDRKRIDEAITELEDRITGQEQRIANTKEQFGQAMAEAGAPLPPEQIDLLLDSVTGSDLVELAAAYEAVRGVSQQLRDLMDSTGEDLTYARRYYGMHTALIALLAEAQNHFMRQVEQEYLPKLQAVERDLALAEKQTQRLLRDEPTDAQRKALDANRESQKVAREALRFYRDYLTAQRDMVRGAHASTLKELRVADNTLRTVDASFQLKQLMESTAMSFEALQSLESPGFERVFRNEDLRREFKELTEKLGPTS
ncbi:MAG: hypothetical protein MRY63_04885 [Neomegalonema sp.]|nr:hypothetical protein [Neomegalonema sp.]